MVLILLMCTITYGKFQVSIKFIKTFLSGQICDTHMFAYQLEWNPVNLVPNGPQNQNIVYNYKQNKSFAHSSAVPHHFLWWTATWKGLLSALPSQQFS